MLWVIMAVMLIAGVVFVALPIYRQQKQVSSLMIASVVVIVALSAGLYSRLGVPGASTSHPVAAAADGSDVASVEDMVGALAARLEENPEDLAGWQMLGRSYVQLGDYPRAVAAFEKAVELESGNNAQTLVDLGEAILMMEGANRSGRAAQLFENALAMAPNNPKALFFGGIAAFDRGDSALAADRWETLLESSPPAEIQDILRQRIAEWRGTSVADVAAPPVDAPNAEGVTVAVAIDDQARAAVGSDATLFILARDPAQPSPPIAAVRRRVSELPAEVSLSDADSMIPGRLISQFRELEIVARVSQSGQPIAQSGDWYGEQIITVSDSATASITIDQQVP